MRTTPYISIKQAIERLNGAVGKSLLYEMVAAGLLRHTRLGVRILIDADHLDQVLAQNMRGPVPDVVVVAKQEAPVPPPAAGTAQRSPERSRGARQRRQTPSRLDLW